MFIRRFLFDFLFCFLLSFSFVLFSIDYASLSVLPTRQGITNAMVCMA